MTLKKIISLGIIISAALGLSGCSVASLNELAQYTDNADQAVYNVRDRNLEFIEQLKDQGYLTPKQSEEWKGSVENKINGIISALEKTDNTVSAQIRGAITNETYEGHKNFGNFYYNIDGKVYSVGGKHRGGHTLSHELDSENDIAGVFYKTTTCDEIKADGTNTCSEEYEVAVGLDSFPKFNAVHSYLQDSSYSKPFELYDSSQIQTLESNLGSPIYVIQNFDGADKSSDKLQLVLTILNEDKESALKMMEEYELSDWTIKDGSDTVYKINKLVNSIGNLTADQEGALEEYLLSYCKPVTDSEGKAVTLIKLKGYENGIRKTADGTPCIFSDTVLNETVESGTSLGRHIGASDESNGLGKDLAILSDGKVSVFLRFMEFNPDLLDLIWTKTKDGVVTKDKYYITQNASKKAAIKLDYPLYKISGIETDSLSSKEWKCTFEETGLSMDLTDGAFYDMNGYKLDYKGDNFKYNNMSFSFGDTSLLAKTKVGEGLIEVDVCPLILKDYVELYQIKYSDGKGISNSDGEYWTPLGRRLRVKQFKSTEGDLDKQIYEFAQSINIDGTYSDNTNYISLDKIASKESGYGFFESAGVSLGLGVNNMARIQTALDGDRTDRVVDSTGMIVNDESFGFGMTVYEKAISPVMCIGESEKSDEGTISPGLAQIDHDKVYSLKEGKSYECPTIYGMCLISSIYETNITGGDWIGSTTADCRNVNEWNKWLKNNGFTYQINLDRLMELLGNNNHHTQDGDGAITFSKGVIENLNKNFKNKKEQQWDRLQRTLARIMGLILNGYALILIGAWVFDTNVSFGPRLLTILTFGKWVAVVDLDDDMNYKGSDIVYVDFRILMISVLLIMATGIMCMVFDFKDLYDKLFGLVSGIYNLIAGLITSR